MARAPTPRSRPSTTPPGGSWTTTGIPGRCVRRTAARTPSPLDPTVAAGGGLTAEQATHRPGTSRPPVAGSGRVLPVLSRPFSLPPQRGGGIPMTRWTQLLRALTTATLLAAGLLFAGPTGLAHADEIPDPAGDILPTYTGVVLPGMDVLAHRVTFEGDRVVFYGRMAGPIAPTQ